MPVLQGVAGDFMGSAQMSVAQDGTLAYAPGTSVSAPSFTRQLAWIDASGATSTVTSRTAQFSFPRLSPDETRIAVGIIDNARNEQDVWVLDIEQDSLTRLTSEGGWGPRWSPDGTWIYFNHVGAGTGLDIWRRRADFSAPAEPVFEEEGDQTLRSVAPDGQSLLYVLRIDPPDGEEERRDDIWILPLDGSDPIAVVQSPDRELTPEFSPDGRLIAYESTESGTTQVYVREIDGGRRWTVSPGRGIRPRWSPDGSRLYFETTPGSGAYVEVEFDDEYRQSTLTEVSTPGAG